LPCGGGAPPPPPQELLPSVVTGLVQTPMTKQRAKAIGVIALATATTIHYHADRIFSVMLESLAKASKAKDSELESCIKEGLSGLFEAVGEDGLKDLCGSISQGIQDASSATRYASCWCAGRFFTSTKTDFEGEVRPILKDLVNRFNDVEDNVVRESLRALDDLIKSVEVSAMVQNIGYINATLGSLISDAKHRTKSSATHRAHNGVSGPFYLPAYNLPDICLLSVMLPLFDQGIKIGNEQIREQSVNGLSDILSGYSSVDAKLVKKIIASMIRMSMDKYPSKIIAGSLKISWLLLEKEGALCKSFYPQLQNVFIKNLADKSDLVREHAELGVMLLAPYLTRVDNLVKSLLDGCLKVRTKSDLADSPEGQVSAMYSYLLSLHAVMRTIGEKLDSEKTQGLVNALLSSANGLIEHEDDRMRRIAADIAGLIARQMETAALQELFDGHLDLTNRTLNDDDARVQSLHGYGLAFAALVRRAPACVTSEKAAQGVSDLAQRLLASELAMGKEGGCALALSTHFGGMDNSLLSAVATTLMPSVVNCMVRDPSSMLRGRAVTMAGEAVLKTVLQVQEIENVDNFKVPLSGASSLVEGILKLLDDESVRVKTDVETTLLYVLQVDEPGKAKKHIDLLATSLSKKCVALLDERAKPKKNQKKTSAQYCGWI
jgi:hypothetical protein